MGNKIGFEADNEKVKIAYIEENAQHINFIMSLKSKFLKGQLKWGNSIIFLFQCQIEEFLSYDTTQNVQLLRNQYQKLLNSDQLVIRTNRETINMLSQNKILFKALSNILMREFKLQHTERIDNSISAMLMLDSNSHEFYKFKQTFTITQLHNFSETYIQQHHSIKHLPDKFLLVILRNGIAAYRIQRGKKTQRVDGSVIGEKTILSILKFKYPQHTIQRCFEMAFKSGNLKNVDLMVEDIYGQNSQSLGLPGNIVASSMAKISRMQKNQLSNLKQEDVVRSIINTFAINSANLIALYLHKTNLKDAVVLADNFHDDKFYSLLQCIVASYAPGKSIYFSKHAPFMGCLGTVLNKSSHNNF